MADVGKLIRVLHRMAYGGHSVVVIEHDLDVLAEADWVVDLGPEGWVKGRAVVAGVHQRSWFAMRAAKRARRCEGCWRGSHQKQLASPARRHGVGAFAPTPCRSGQRAFPNPSLSLAHFDAQGGPLTSTLRAFAFIAIVCGFGGALAQPASSSSGPTSRPAPATVEARSASAPTAVSSAEVAVLQAQLAVMQVFTDRILSTVYWAIGGVFAIAALLIGYNVFSSYRMQNREIANLTADLQHGQELALALMNDQMDKLTKKYEAGITAAAEKAAAVGLADVKKRLDTQRSMLDGQQLSLARHVMKSEARYWELSKVGGNEIRSLLGLLEHDLKTSDDLEMGDVLMRIQELLPELAEIYPDDANMLHELLGKLPAKLNPQIAAVRKELSKVKLG